MSIHTQCVYQQNMQSLLRYHEKPAWHTKLIKQSPHTHQWEVINSRQLISRYYYELMCDIDTPGTASNFCQVHSKTAFWWESNITTLLSQNKMLRHEKALSFYVLVWGLRNSSSLPADEFGERAKTSGSEARDELHDTGRRIEQCTWSATRHSHLSGPSFWENYQCVHTGGAPVTARLKAHVWLQAKVFFNHTVTECSHALDSDFYQI